MNVDEQNLTHGALEPGTLIDEKYRIDALIGEGGMGAVYEATHTNLNRKVAIKCLRPEFSADKRLIKRLEQEARIAGSLGHDNICEVTDIGTLRDGSPFLVMPFLKGRTLSELLKEDAPLDSKRVCDIVVQILSALSVAHEAQIVHRDLKPDNIFVGRFGDRNDFVKLLDFGISKIKGRSEHLEITRTGAVLGTPFYMSPEQAGGLRTIDNRSDIYSVGVILYQSLTSRRPFEGDSYNEVIAKILTEPFPSPRSLVPMLPQALERVVLKSMERDPAQRYASASAMRSALVDAEEKLNRASSELDNYSLIDTAEQSIGNESARGVSKLPCDPRKNKPLVLGVLLALAVTAIALSVFLRFSAQTNFSLNETINVPPKKERVPTKMPPKAEESISAPKIAAGNVKPVEDNTVLGTMAPKAQAATQKLGNVKSRKLHKKKEEVAEPSFIHQETSNNIEPKQPPPDQGIIKGRQGTMVISDYE
jgi:serine/threonine protein kinase